MGFVKDTFGSIGKKFKKIFTSDGYMKGKPVQYEVIRPAPPKGIKPLEVKHRNPNKRPEPRSI